MSDSSHGPMHNAPGGATEWCYRCNQYCGGTVECDCCQHQPVPPPRPARTSSPGKPATTAAQDAEAERTDD